MLSVIQAIEGHIGITECYHNEDSHCMQMPRCNIRTPLRNIQNSIYGLLDSMSIEDMKEFGSATIVRNPDSTVIELKREQLAEGARR